MLMASTAGAENVQERLRSTRLEQHLNDVWQLAERRKSTGRAIARDAAETEVVLQSPQLQVLNSENGVPESSPVEKDAGDDATSKALAPGGGAGQPEPDSESTAMVDNGDRGEQLDIGSAPNGNEGRSESESEGSSESRSELEAAELGTPATSIANVGTAIGATLRGFVQRLTGSFRHTGDSSVEEDDKFQRGDAMEVAETPSVKSVSFEEEEVVSPTGGRSDAIAKLRERLPAQWPRVYSKSSSFSMMSRTAPGRSILARSSNDDMIFSRTQPRKSAASRLTEVILACALDRQVAETGAD